MGDYVKAWFMSALCRNAFFPLTLECIRRNFHFLKHCMQKEWLTLTRRYVGPYSDWTLNTCSQTLELNATIFQTVFIHNMGSQNYTQQPIYLFILLFSIQIWCDFFFSVMTAHHHICSVFWLILSSGINSQVTLQPTQAASQISTHC